MGKLLIGADVVPTKSNAGLFSAGGALQLLGSELKKLFDSAEYRIVNLEVPLTDQKSPIVKCGPNLIAPTCTINGYKAIGIDAVSLANNHIMDQGVQGFDSTRKLLHENNIKYVGAGLTPEEAAAPIYFDFAGKRISVYACAEHEFTIVSNEKPGANPFDPLETPDHIAALRRQCDYVIVLYHGGKEHYRYPSPNLQKTCRKLVDKGADLVICQHSHCVGCKEDYNGGTIVYGQGNLLFDHSKSEYWQTALLVCINEELAISYIPIRKTDNTVRMAKEEDANEILAGFYTRSKEIILDGMVEKRYSEYVSSMLDSYLWVITGKNSFFIRLLNKICVGRLRKWILRSRYPQKRLLALRNYIECEAHWELLLTGIIQSSK